MCKIMIIPGIKSEYSKNAWAFARAARPSMTKWDNDAFGYAALGSKGIFGEKWLDVGEAFRPRRVLTEGAKRLRALFGTIPKHAEPGDYDSFGAESTKNISAMILHSRMATCGGGIENAHPFYIDGAALIHNGVIQNSKELVNKVSTCDSEVILNEYLSKGVTEDPTKIQDVADKLMGWYAVAVLAPNTEHGHVIDVFREPGADLHAAYVEELDTVVFATKGELIQSAAYKCGFRVGRVITVPSEQFFRINARTGELISEVPFASGLAEELYYANKGTKANEYGDEAYERALAAWQNNIVKPIQPVVSDVSIGKDGLEDTDEVEDVASFIDRTGTNGKSYADAVRIRHGKRRGVKKNART